MSKISLGDIAQKWVHSHEEDTASEMVFRPATFKFPPSRGRRSFELNSNGSLVDHGIGPDDRPVATPGKWELKGGDRPQLQLEQSGRAARVLDIVAATRDRLVVKKPP